MLIVVISIHLFPSVASTFSGNPHYGRTPRVTLMLISIAQLEFYPSRTSLYVCLTDNTDKQRIKHMPSSSRNTKQDMTMQILTLHDPRPPVVSTQKTPAPMIPKTALQSAFEITGRSHTWKRKKMLCLKNEDRNNDRIGGMFVSTASFDHVHLGKPSKKNPDILRSG